MSRHLTKLPKFCAGGVRRTPFHASAWAFPFEGDAFGNESIDRVSHVREPRTAPHFSVGHDIQSQLDLLFEELKNRAILHGAKLIDGKTARGVRISGS